VLSAFVSLALAQSNAEYCDATTNICYSGYTDPDLDITVGFVLPPNDTTEPQTEYIVQMVAPVSYGYTGISMSGTMVNGLLFVMWPNDGEIVFSTRWTSGYTQPSAYAGPTITMLPGSGVNSTYITASFRCQNCTVWEGGSLGSGNLGAFNTIGYVANTMTPVEVPSNPTSAFLEHDQFDFFGCNLTLAQSSQYSSYISAGTTTSLPPSTPITVPAATQTHYGQCGGIGYEGATFCGSGSTCQPVSPPYYYCCL